MSTKKLLLSKKFLFVALTYPYPKTPPLPNPAPFPGGTATKKWRKLNREFNTHNIIEYKKSNAKIHQRCQKNSIQQFTSDINPYSNPKKTWANQKTMWAIPPKKHPLP